MEEPTNKTRLTHAEFGAAIMRLMPEKESIIAALEKGTAVSAIARQFNLSRSCLVSVLEAMQVNIPKRLPPANVQTDALEALEKRVANLESIVSRIEKPLL